MAEFWYDSTLAEWWELFDAVLQQRDVRFAVDRPYPEPRATLQDRLTDDLRQEIFSTTRSVYLVGDAFSNQPLFLWRQDGGVNAGKYFIDTSRGGPALRMHMPAQFEERGLFWFGEGRLTFQKLYWNDSLTQAYPAPRELKDAFGLIKKTLQQHLLEKQIEKQKMWISPKAWELFEAGKAAFAVAAKCYTVHGEVPPPTPWQYKPIVQENGAPQPPPNGLRRR